jgi:ABC-type multidrug transport system fused ATPase/permease subunit
MSLNGISFETTSSEKIGVIGRTGAGKSSLLAALFKMSDISSGDILIDAVNISRISSRQIRYT